MMLAALLAPLALFQASGALSAEPREARMGACARMVEADAAHAYEEAMAWAADTREANAYRCAAMALAAQGRNEEAGRRFESLAGIVGGESPGLRAELYSQAGNAWLLAQDAEHARGAFSRAIAGMAGDAEVLPDLYIDRARAFALERDYKNAELDLSRALDLRAEDALALRLRATARMHQNAFELALADAEAAARIEPDNVDALLMLGHAREALRTGAAVEEQ